jgi:hypothetical protein
MRYAIAFFFGPGLLLLGLLDRAISACARAARPAHTPIRKTPGPPDIDCVFRDVGFGPKADIALLFN